MNTIAMAMTFLAFVLAIAVRYAAQGLVATLLGDGSPAREGRLTLNPVRHFATLGGVVALVSAFPIAGLPVGLGWGKPMRADVHRFSVGPNTGLIIIAVAGIAANLILGSLIALGLGLIPISAAQQTVLGTCPFIFHGGALQSCLAPWQAGWILRLVQFGYIFASVNFVLAILNLVPLYPLDGYNILFALLPEGPAIAYRKSQTYQELILVGIIFLVPLLLAFSNAPVQFSPSQLLLQGGYSIVNRLSNLPADLALLL